MSNRELWVTVYCKALEVLYLKQAHKTEEIQTLAKGIADKSLEDAPEDNP